MSAVAAGSAETSVLPVACGDKKGLCKCGRRVCSLIVDEVEKSMSAAAEPIIDADDRTIAAINIIFDTGTKIKSRSTA